MGSFHLLGFVLGSFCLVKRQKTSLTHVKLFLSDFWVSGCLKLFMEHLLPWIFLLFFRFFLLLHQTFLINYWTFWFHNNYMAIKKLSMVNHKITLFGQLNKHFIFQKKNVLVKSNRDKVRSWVNPQNLLFHASAMPK